MLLNKIAEFQVANYKNIIQSVFNLPRKVASTKNEQLLQTGIQIRNKIVANQLQEFNPKTRQAGLIQFPTKDTSTQFSNIRQQVFDDVYGRTVRIQYKTFNKMHEVPTQPSSRWVVEFERKAVWKTNHMGWQMSDDQISKRNMEFHSLIEAVEYCKISGLGYEVSYPKFRIHKRKSYSDNFLWPGHDKDEDPDQ